MLKNEWKHLVKNKLMLIVVIAVITIPTIYTTLFLGSMWDPYGNVDQLPVAVVNNDQPVDYEGETLNVGQEMVDQLKDDGSLDFRFVDSEDARQGLADGDYYMVITIPENFSANAASLTGDAPEKMELGYETNPGTNYIASKMSETAMKTIEASVRESVTKTYVQAVYDQIGVIGDGMQEAADGTGELQDGAVQLKDGNATMTDGLQTLADSTLTFVNGSEELTEGLASYVDGVSTVNDGAQTLNDGAQTLNSGAQQVNDGAQSLKDGVQTLNDGTQTLAEGTQTLNGGIQSARDGSAALVSGTQQVDDNMTTLNAGLTQLYSATVTLPESTAALDSGVGSVQSGISQLQSGNQQLQSGAAQLSGGAQQLDAGLAQIVGEDNANSAKLRTGAEQVMGGIDTMVSTMNSMVSSANESLVSTADTVRTSASQIQSNLIDPSDAEESVQTAAAAVTAAVQNGQLSAEDAAVISDALKQSLTAAKTNYACGTKAVEGMNQIADGLEDGQMTLDEATQAKIAALQQGASDLNDGVKNYTAGVDQAAAGTSALVSGASQISNGLTQSGSGLDALANGTAQVKDGTSQLAASAPALSGGIAQARQGGAALQSQGTSVLVGGAAQLYGGLTQLADGSDTLAAGSTTLNAGAQSLLTGSNTLAAGTRSLADGSATLAAGTTTLSDGTRTLVSNNATLMSGANQLTDGARQIADGSDRLLSGSRELGDGLDELYDGADTLKSSLSDAADEVKATNTSDAAVDLFSAPVDTTEEQMTTVENNGHAMAPYMMSVALWVGCIAFSLMYPLTEYYGGKLKSGMAWWFSKASVLYLIAILQALCMLLCLHVFDGFNPANWGLTIAVAVAASLAFMSIMYFFTNFIGKAGSFLMLVFMVVQLAGSVGTYPLELSGGFVKYLHEWVPFTYTVKAFRSTIAGGESVESCIVFMLILFVVFSILSIMVFRGRARKIKAGKPTLHDWLDAHHLA